MNGTSIQKEFSGYWLLRKCRNHGTIQILPEFADADWDDNHDDDWSYGLPLPLPFSQMAETEKRLLTTTFKAETIKLSIDDWLQDIS